MNIRVLYILAIIGAFNWIAVDGKPFLDFLFDKQSFHSSHHYPASGPRSEPVGGKERYKQICNVIHGISSCF